MDNIFIFDEKGYIGNRNFKNIEYIIANNGCWQCISHVGPGNYLYIYRNKRRQYMHRYVYELYNGEIENDLHVMHTCDNTKCINPKHLKLGTHQDNMKDRDLKGRVFKGKNKKLSERNKKFNNEQLAEIKNMLIQGKTAVEISKIFKVTHFTIYSIKNGKSYYTEQLGGGLNDWLKEANI